MFPTSLISGQATIHEIGDSNAVVGIFNHITQEGMDFILGGGGVPKDIALLKSELAPTNVLTDAEFNAASNPHIKVFSNYYYRTKVSKNTVRLSTAIHFVALGEGTFDTVAMHVRKANPFRNILLTRAVSEDLNGIPLTFELKQGQRYALVYDITISLASVPPEFELMVDTTTVAPDNITEHYETTVYRNQYVPGSNKLEFTIEDTKTFGDVRTSCLYFPMFTIQRRSTTTSGRRIRYEFNLEPLSDETLTKYGITVTPPEPYKSVTFYSNIDTIATGSPYQYPESTNSAIKFDMTPLTQVRVYYGDTLIGVGMSDVNGIAIVNVRQYHQDPFTNTSRQINDGMVLTARYKNSAGENLQTFIVADTTTNDPAYVYWLPNGKLHVGGTLGDTYFFSLAPYVDDKNVLHPKSDNIQEVTLTERDTTYGEDGASAEITLDLTPYNVPSNVEIRVSRRDASGNLSEADRYGLYSSGYFGKEQANLGLLSSLGSHTVNDGLFIHAAIVKGTIS